MAEYREAIRLKPDLAEAHNNVGIALGDRGDPDGAIAEYREAIRLEPEFAEAYVNLGTALAANGDPDGAIREYRWAIRMRPDLGQAHANLGNALATKGDVARAVEAYREAVRLMPDDADAHYALGIGLRSTGDLGGAIEEFRDAVRIRQDFAEAHCDLGHALSIQGRFREAVSSYRRGHEVGSKRSDWVYPTGMWIESAERVSRLEEAVDALLSGEAQPRDALERTAFGVLLYARAHHAEAARQYEKAFAEDPALAEDLKSDHRYNAACCAALAAARGGKDAAEWRGRALRWLRVDLAARERAEMRVGHWKEDPDLAVVRSRLSDLPAPEREEWTRLWADVDALLAKARER
jgi:tetratricopeptide (TPR) repeat protein